MKDSQRNATTAVSLPSDGDNLESLPELGADASASDVLRRARIVRKLIRMRAMLHETRSKSDELKNAIERFKERKAKISSG
jgi:hypothetical protein